MTSFEGKKPSELSAGTQVRVVDPTDSFFEGRIGVVVERPPARYVFVKFEGDHEESSGHPFRVDELSPLASEEPKP